MEFALFMIYLYWLAIVSTLWYLVLIPFWICLGVGIYYKNFKIPLVGLALSFVFSLEIATIAVFFLKP
jgi:hypothetical protein